MGVLDQYDSGFSVDPANRHPLWLRAKSLDCLSQLVVCHVYVVVDDSQVKVVFVAASDLTTLLLCVDEVSLL